MLAQTIAGRSRYEKWPACTLGGNPRPYRALWVFKNRKEVLKAVRRRRSGRVVDCGGLENR